MLSPLILTAVLAAPVALPSETLEQRWRVVLFDGQKVGHALSERQRLGERYVSREVMDLEIHRAGEPVRLYSEQVVQESLALTPLAFSVRMKSSGVEQRVDATVDAGRVQVKIDGAGAISEREFDLPAGALMAEAQLARLRDSGLKAGTTVEFSAFEPSLLEAVRIETEVIGPRRVAVMDQDRELIEVLQTAHFPGNAVQTRAWVDADFTPYRLSMELLGMRIEMVDCSRSCALAPNQPVDYLQRLLLTPPAPLPSQALEPGLRYTLEVRGEGGRIGATAEQRVSEAGDALVVEVCRSCDGESAAEPGPEWLAPTPWIQSTDPLIVKLAGEAADAAAPPGERMRAAEAWVRRYIRNKNLAVGYASALETAQSRSGDCTEHALLLAALGRALGVPTRVATGLAYAEGYGESGRAFVPHAWTQAWVDGRWQSFDAALDGFDAGHLALAVGDGDPSRFYSGISLLGRLGIREVSVREPTADAKSP